MKTYSTAFYKVLGQLFYGIAAADKKVLAEEYYALKKILETEWPMADAFKNSTTSVDIQHILTEFKTLYKKEQVAPETWLEAFFSFKKKNETLFTKSLNQLILNTAHTIANSFARKNKSELIMLAKLDLELNKE
ncbi:hypothetical protein [Jejuia pallidilutea]|jgi:hypothetical protein|uniref:Uncharacterized protein n=1 Tax=Jejuia pallidilutea TaxID=504487 RepID=A0A098LQM5_9FLAO|nr:hypothetical protein [Jejuia pallidilutea]GAL88553.1 hypothetical protein JCM19538_3066 [Jejuia pallidilutea]